MGHARQLFLLGAILGALSSSAGAKDYWEGNQLNNQARLGQPFNGFEVTDPAEKRDKAQQNYDARVNAERSHHLMDNSRGTLVDLGGIGTDQFLTVSRLENGGKRFTLRLNVLFGENTADYRQGSVTLLERLDTLLQAAAKNNVQLAFVDDAGSFPGVQELHIQRVSTVLAYLSLHEAEGSN